MRARLILRIVQTLVGAASAVAILLEQQNLPSAAFWRDHPGYFYVALVGFVAAALFLPIDTSGSVHQQLSLP